MTSNGSRVVGATALVAAVSCLGCNAVLGIEPGETLCDATWAHWEPGAERSYETDAQTALDRVTGLRWSRAPNPAAGLEAAASLCEQAEIGGEADWRLPTRVEMLSLLELGRSPAVDAGVFSVSGDVHAFWTSSRPTNKPVLLENGGTMIDYDLTVDVATGHVIRVDPGDPAQQLLSLCVRAEEVQVPSGAAATCPERYAVEQDGAVIRDRETGLAWQQGGSEAAAPALDDARAICAGLTLGGGGFRVPTAGELQTLVDEATPAGVAIDAHFEATSDYYWASLDDAAEAERAWVVSFYTGEAFSVPASGPFPDGSDPVKRVRCVR